MIQISINIATGAASTAGNTTLKAGGLVPVKITFSEDPGTLPLIELALSPESSSPSIIAYLEEFQRQNPTTFTGWLNANDTRLIEFLTGKTSAAVFCEVAYTINGDRRNYPNLKLTVQPPVIAGPAASEGGPFYYTTGQIDEMFNSLTIDSDDIEDSTEAGRALLTASDAAAQRTTLGLGSGATLNVSSAGDASSDQLVKGSDSRLSDARTPTSHSHTASDITDSTAVGRALLIAADAPTQRAELELGSAAILNVPASGDATAGEIVKGSDSRLSDARTPTSHSHVASDITDSTAVGRALLMAASSLAQRQTLGIRIYRKLSDTPRSNTTTHTNDPELNGIPLVAGKTYRIIGQLLFYNSAAGSGFSGSTNSNLHVGTDITLWLETFGHNSGKTAYVYPDTVLGGFTHIITGGSTGVTGGIRSEAIVKISTTGNLDYKWAQSTATASTTTLRKGSYISVEELD